MKKSGVAIFVTLAVIVVAIVAVAIKDEGASTSNENAVANADEETSQELFATNCGSCHALAAAGTDGVVGPNLDELLGQGTPEGNEPRVLSAIEQGVNGRMPAGILAGQQAEQVAAFVANEAGQ